MMAIILRRPTLADAAALEAAQIATKVSDPNFLHYYTEGMAYTDWLALLDKKTQGIDLDAEHAPSTFYFGFVGDKIAGRLSIRHDLTEATRNIGGHIGYVVVPEFRRRGYATEMLAQSLKIAKERGLERVLLTCDQGNIASQKTIERCGGVLENFYHSPDSKVPKMHFWIYLQKHP